YDRLGQLGANYRWQRLDGFNKRTVFMGSTEVTFTSQQSVNEIRYTTDGSAPILNSTLYKSPFVISKSTTVKLIEITPKLKTSQVYTANYIKLEPQESVDVTGNISGLKYQYFEFEKELNSVKELKEMNPVSEGITTNFAYPFSNEKLPDKFGLTFNGFIEVPTEAIYYFGVLSNDGSRLFVADQLVVDNDGRHGAYEKTEGIVLKPGFHKIKLEYFQAGGGKALQVFISGDEFKKTEITASMLSH
ncbi:MAG: chitobiase/beta-hexosaminidase C-terminal domain-containing protein, partial [Flavobacteriaceae bacterium]|nr:chitobiase/beta-hexosaminidase C-terminal domain-containing protein [Flavobacteriaceae bacterium]